MLRSERFGHMFSSVAEVKPQRIATLRSFHQGDRHKAVKPGIYEDKVLGGVRIMTPNQTGETFIILAAARDRKCMVRLDDRTGYTSIDGIISDGLQEKLDATEPGRDFFLHTLRVQVLTAAEVRQAVCKMPVWVMGDEVDKVRQFQAHVPLNAPMLREPFFAEYQEMEERETETEESPYRSR